MDTFRTSGPPRPADRHRPHLILVGLPGSGKTTVGRAVAERLGRPFLDFDDEIVAREGMSVAEIFATWGESHFRDLERQVTAELVETGGFIVAPGGGWITNAEAVAAVRPGSRLIYLRVRPATALARLGESLELRPLLRRADPLLEIVKLLSLRGPLYEMADLVIDSELLDLQTVIHQVETDSSAV